MTPPVGRPKGLAVDGFLVGSELGSLEAWWTGLERGSYWAPPSGCEWVILCGAMISCDLQLRKTQEMLPNILSRVYEVLVFFPHHHSIISYPAIDLREAESP